MNKFFSIVDDNVKKGTAVRAVLGNHEFFSDSANTVSKYLAASGYRTEDADIEIGGYHFIFLCPDKGGTGYSDSKIEWLNNRLKIDSLCDVTGTKPIFVFQHHHVSDTVYGHEGWGVSDLKSTLDKYPQVVDFSGHSHFPINDPRSIWQGTFTALGTGTLSYYEMGIAGVKDYNVFGSDKKGGYTNSRVDRDAAQYYIVEINGKNEITVKGYDLLSDTFICEYNFTIGDTSKFVYTDARKLTSETPYFEAEAEITVSCSSNGTSVFTIPQAKCADNVQHYRFEVYNAAEQLVSKTYSLSDTFYFPMPETIEGKASGLVTGQSYTVKCYAVSSWEKESKPITAEFVYAN